MGYDEFTNKPEGAENGGEGGWVTQALPAEPVSAPTQQRGGMPQAPLPPQSPQRPQPQFAPGLPNPDHTAGTPNWSGGTQGQQQTEREQGAADQPQRGPQPPATPAQHAGSVQHQHASAQPPEGQFQNGAQPQSAPPPQQQYNSFQAHHQQPPHSGFGQFQPQPYGQGQQHHAAEAQQNRTRYTAAAASQSATEQLSALTPTKQSQLKSTSGARGTLNRLGLHVGLSKKEQAHLKLVERIRTPLAESYRVAVLALKGGVGKSTTTVGLGSVMSYYRPDRLIALDANPDFGILDRRSVGSASAGAISYRDVVSRADQASSYAHMRSMTAVNEADLEVLRSGFSLTEAGMTADDYGVVDDVLARHYNLMLVDCGTDVRGRLLTRILDRSAAVIVVADTTKEGVQGAAATIDWLRAHGYEELLAKMVIAVNLRLPGKQILDVDAIVEGFSRQQRPVHVIPWDPHIAEGDVIDMRKMKKRTVAAYEHLAASVADEFASTTAQWR